MNIRNIFLYYKRYFSSYVLFIFRMTASIYCNNSCRILNAYSGLLRQYRFSKSNLIVLAISLYSSSLFLLLPCCVLQKNISLLRTFNHSAQKSLKYQIRKLILCYALSEFSNSDEKKLYFSFWLFISVSTYYYI